MQSQDNVRPKLLYRKSVIFFCMVYIISAPSILQWVDHSEKANHIPATKVDSEINIVNHYSNCKKQIASPDIEKLKKSDWYASVVKTISQREYQFAKSKTSDTYSTLNRKNNLRFLYDDNGFTARPAITQIPGTNNNSTKATHDKDYKTIPDWKVRFLFDKKQVGRGQWIISENKAEYKTSNIMVEYINSDEGMRQNFIVQKPLSDTNLKLNFTVKTSLTQQFASNGLKFIHPKSGAVLNYNGLKVWDAEGKLLNASFEKNNSDYSIYVNTGDAKYPITIDPVSTSPASSLINYAGTSEFFGYSVASAGDVNADGYSDIIVGSNQYDFYEYGAAYIYYGSASGIRSDNTDTIFGDQEFEHFATSVASAGDINGDGYSDVIVGAPYYPDQSGRYVGATFIYFGSSAGINKSIADTLRNAQAETNTDNATFGNSVAGAGDLNGDGYSDVVVGFPHYNNNKGRGREGAAFIYLGSSTGINKTASDTLKSNQARAQMGFSVTAAGDVNGDGLSDLIVGAPYYDDGQTNEGAAFIYYGNAVSVDTIPKAIVESNQDFSNLGYAVASAGDVNADGYSDVIVGSPYFGNSDNSVAEGTVFIYYGSASGIDTTAASVIASHQLDSQFGIAVASAGDVDGDGYSDVIIGADMYDNRIGNEGLAFVYHGSTTGINITRADTLSGEVPYVQQMGSAVASAGDVNGDGISDVIVGDWAYHPVADDIFAAQGAAFVYNGSSAGINKSPAVIAESSSISQSGTSVANAGDVNGDGYSDIIVGAYFYTNGQTGEGAAFLYYGSDTGISAIPSATLESNSANANMGWSVAAAGDINGDGFGDVIVGAPYYGQFSEGAALIYMGSATGIITTPVVLKNNQDNAAMGWFVAGAGDVNGDGYNDVIVGSPQYDNGPTSNAGAIFIYYGSATGLITTSPAMIQGNTFMGQIGFSVSGAGDVNGDQYADVIVGGLTGAAYIYLGSNTGINPTAASTLTIADPGAEMGYAVGGIGDVNGDGYSDVIVGAPSYQNGQASEGAVFVYYGSSAGVANAANVTIEGNLANLKMGAAVAGAGDINGDGYNDIIIGLSGYSNGQAGEGGAYIYRGSPTGILTASRDTVESNRPGASMGFAAAGAGDLNGDGYSDIVIGAPYDNGNRGTAFIYYGNNKTSNTNNRNNLRLYNTSLTTQLNSTNFPAANFGAGLFAKSFLGKTKGKLVWETSLSYNKFNGTPITNSIVYTAQQSSYSDLGLGGAELKNLIDKQRDTKFTKIRARVKFDPATAITGQVYGPWRYVPDQIMGLSLGVLPVELVSFTATWQQQGKAAKINFTTSNENSVCCYEIEKSADGINFVKIGKLTAANSSSSQTYTFIDINANGKKQYYRIKILRQTGAVDYSNIQLLQYNKSIEILVFPNPATDVLQLRLNDITGKVTVQIVNSAGQVVKKFDAATADNQTITIPVNNLSDGVYFLYLQSGNKKQVLQFVKE